MIIFINSIKDENSRNKFEEIYYIYSKYLYSIGVKILRDSNLASDALQQCFMKIFQNIDKINIVQSKQTKSFVSVIMRNEAFIIYNKYRSIVDITESFDDELINIDENTNIDEVLARAELREEVSTYLGLLNKGESDILILKFIKGYSYEEIAKLLGITNDLARQRLLRAKKKLAKLIINFREEA